MGNMGYCRFENTVRDMEDCLDAINDAGSVEEYLEQISSPHERSAFFRFFEICREALDDHEADIEDLES